jgi:hypothetical protein
VELRVLVMGLDGLVGEMIRAAVEARPGLVLVRAPDTSDVYAAIGATQPDAIVVGTGDAGLGPWWMAGLRARPGMRVVALDALRGTGVLYEMRPHAVPLGDVSPADIVTAIDTPPRDPRTGTEASRD